MTDFILRYISGDCQAVRDELRASIDEHSSSEQLAVAMAVADEFVTRSIANVSNVYDALVAVEYQFANPDNALVLCDSPDDHSVADFEKQMGKLPFIASRWYRRITSLDFTQTREQLTDRHSPLAGLGWGIPLVVQSLEKAREHWAEHRSRYDKDEMSRSNAGYACVGPPKPTLLTGGSASNCECKGFILPSYRFDDVLYNDGGGDQYFGDEIARGFQCGGFPVLSAPERILKYVRSLYGEPNREFLSTRLPSKLREV